MNFNKHPLSDEMKIEDTKFYYFTTEIHKVNRLALLDWFTIRERRLLVIDKSLSKTSVITVDGTEEELTELTKNFLVNVSFGDKEDYVYGVVSVVKDDKKYVMLMYISQDSQEPPYAMNDKFIMDEEMISNYHGEPVLTDVGKFFLNSILIVKPLKSKIEYINRRIDPGELDDKVAALLKSKEIGRAEYNAYMNWGYWYGNDGSIATSVWSEKSLTTDPRVPARRDELFEKYKDQLDDPIVISMIEKELIQMDRDWIKGDSSEAYLESAGGGTYKETRKKLFLTVGLGIAFDKNTGSYEVVKESLSEGWTKENISVMANDIRRGSYGRGMKTAEGGALTKESLRTYQSIAITEYDCKSKLGISVAITDDNYKDWEDRVLVPSGEILTASSAKKLIGKTVIIRSPEYCKTKGGYCDICCGLNYSKSDIKNIGMQVLTATSDFTLVAMKSMHVSGITTRRINEISKYLR